MSRKTYLLVPGAWHGSRCWDEVARMLKGEGHDPRPVDLQGCEPDTASAAKVTLDAWVGWVCSLIKGLRQPVTLVGHSRAGIVISQAAQRLPDQVEELVYVSGLLIRSGESALGVLREDGTSPLLRHVSLSVADGEWTLPKAVAPSLFYGKCSAHLARDAVEMLGREPSKPLMTPLRLSEEGFGRVPRCYVECLQDAAVPIGLQRVMRARIPCGRIVTLDTDHAPFLSAPEALVEALLNRP